MFSHTILQRRTMDNCSHTEKVQELFVRNISRIRGYIIGMFPDASQADDVVQEVFLVVTRKADDFEIGTDFMAWVRSIARLKVLETIRRSGKQPMFLSEETIDALAAASSETDGNWDARRTALEKCLKKVPPRAMKILQLRYADGLMPQQIANLVSWTVNAVSVQISRLRKSLMACMQREMARVNA